MRLFYAITLEDQIRRELCSAMQSMRQCFQSGRFSPEENLHLTLVFLGEVAPEQLDDAKGALDAARGNAFSLHIGGIGCFRRDGGDIYWAGIERTQPLSNLYFSLCTELRGRGFSVERRAFHPHLTLVRQAVLKTECDRSVFVVPMMSMEVDRVSLMLSERSRGRMVYTNLHTSVLKGVTPA
jgi:RNA 2',3'-cyclic 3'-phosphodiesterase